MIILICTFFGHKDTPSSVEPILISVLTDLILNKNVRNFYVGNNGNFDYYVRKTLKKLKQDFPDIIYSVVLAYLPVKNNCESNEDYSDTIFPDCLENTPPKYAISKRNLWMINKSDYVVTYVRYNTGGAAKFKEIAEKKHKIVINLP